MRWQKKARIVVALGGVGVAGVVFFAIGKRESPTPVAAPTRLDPTAIIESSGALVRQIRGVKEDYQIKAQRQLTYQNGASKSLDVEITVRGRGGRDFVMTAGEAQAGEEHATVDIAGNVKLAASDGFEVTTDRATYNDAEGLVRAAGTLAFHRGGMTGSGVGMTYDKNSDVLTILDQAHVAFVDAGGTTSMQFSGGTATLSRPEHLLRVQRAVHAMRGEQTIETDSALARLTDKDDQITYIELRGNARVAGGSTAFDSMSARDIDLDYTDDGAQLERVALNGSAAVALAGRDQAPGRQFFGETLTLTLASDNTVTSIVGRDNVRLDLPGTKEAPRRSVRARSLEANGEPGKGLAAARFTDNVEYQEDAAKPGAAPRTARARSLRVSLTGDSFTSALFTGAVRFEEQGLQAGAAQAQYEPESGSLHLQGTDDGGGPHVSDQQVSIQADTIDVTLEGRRMRSAGGVKTTLQDQKGRADRKMPGVLQEGRPANVNADSLQYDGESGRAVYTGQVQLWQGETAIRADRIAIERATGDLVATGNARSTLSTDTGASIGRADEIRFADAKRELEYRTAGAPAPPIAAGAPQAPRAQLSGPQGDLRSDRIVVSLAKTDNHIERLDAHERVTLRLDTRTASASRLTYYARDERYVLSGAPASPVKVLDRCSETTGKTLTFFKSTDRMVVDGNEEIRTQTKSGSGPCPEPRSP